MDEEEGEFVAENTAYVTFKACNLLTSRGFTHSMSFIIATSKEKTNPLQKHFVRQGYI